MNGFAPFFWSSIVHNRLFFVYIHVVPAFFRTSDQKFSNEDSILELIVALGYAAFARCCSSSLSASRTALAVWIPKKMYRISVPRIVWTKIQMCNWIPID